MLKFAVLGSHISKKAVECFDKEAAALSIYAPKVSLFSLYGRTFGVDVQEVLGDGADSFIANVLQRDLSKTFAAELRSEDPDVVVVDFVDDVHDLLVDTESGRRITDSHYTSYCKLEALSPQWRRVKRDSDEAWQFWEEGCMELGKSLQGRKTLLVQLMQSDSYQLAGVPHKYTLGRSAQVAAANQIIERCQRLFRKHVTCVEVATDGAGMCSQTPEDAGFFPTNVADATIWSVARAIAKPLGIEAFLGTPSTERIDRYFEAFSTILDAGDPPSIAELHLVGRRYLLSGDLKKARWTERLIQLIRNSSVPLSVKMGKVTFGYGGIGVIIHAQCTIGDYVVIGSNVTLGGGKELVDESGVVRKVPHVGDRVYIGTGAKLLGGITIGHHCVIGANAVVTSSIPPYSVVAGSPGRVIKQITPDNFADYASYLYKGLSESEARRLTFGS